VSAPSGTPEKQNKWSRPAFQALLHYGGSALALFLLFHFLPRRQVWQALRALPLQLWIEVLAGYFGGHCLGIAKWRRIVNSGGAGLSVAQAARCYFAGLFGSLFLPSLIGGDLVRAALALRLGRSKAGILLGSVLDRIVDFAALVILAGAGSLIVPRALDARGRGIFLALGAAAVLIAAGVAIAAAMVPVKKFSYRIRRRFVRLRRASRSMAQNPSTVVGALGLAICAQLIFIFLSIELAKACGLNLTFRAWLLAWPLAKLSAAIPVTQGGIGVREAALAALLLPFGAPAALTVAAGLAWEAIVVSGGILSGLLSLAIGRSSSSEGKS
jgi:glycosyltransferase 2 family protein